MHHAYSLESFVNAGRQAIPGVPVATRSLKPARGTIGPLRRLSVQARRSCDSIERDHAESGERRIYAMLDQRRSAHSIRSS